MSYRNLEIWKLAKKNTIDIHFMTLDKLPKFELYEEGSQIRRSSKSVRTNIVEGYGRRASLLDYLRFLKYAIASNDETMDHLDTLCETNSLQDSELYQKLKDQTDHLGKMLNNFIRSVENRKK